MPNEMSDAYQWHGRTMFDSAGEKIGKIDEIYEDPETGKAEWATVNTGLFGTKSNFVPLAGATTSGEDVRAHVTKAQVKDAPGVEAAGELSEQEEQHLFEHYGVPYTQEGSTTAQGAPQAGEPARGRQATADRTDEYAGGRQETVGETGEYAGGRRETAGRGGEGHRERSGERGVEGHDVSGPTTDEAMTRSEEELRVGTQRREAGRARLRKYVVTDMETRTVPVQREEVRVEREPITEANREAAMAGGEMTDEEHEVVLHEDEVLVDKHAVPKERVALGKDVVTDEQQVTEEVRKEEIDTEGLEAGERGGRRGR
ncbi:MAG: DUF2382 domain-containing protein [Solirubrobacterales bacterium]|nr:DUF2382 domain-containing protein [Solirubrobacterales bacterium]